MRESRHRSAAEAAVQHAIAPANDEHVLDADAARRILVDWNRTERPYDRAATVCRLVLAQAQAHPRRVAVIDGLTEIDYRQLTARADAIAGALAARGVQPGALVGVCMQRTWDLVATLLGVMRAGCAYVPLDPAYPRERVRYMLEHAQAVAVVVDGPATSALCAGASVQVRLDTVPAQAQAADTPPEPAADDLAYVIYTSGSTGRPKGVAVEHRQAVAMTCAMRELLDDEDLAGVLAAASVCFDTSVMEILGTLSLGGTVVLADNALALATLPAAERVRTTVMVPSSMQALLATGGLPRSVRCTVLGGDVLKAPLVAQLHALPQRPRVFNFYGPTEDTVFSTATELPAGRSTVTIGRPVANARSYILDEALQPVPVGVAGELYLAGDKLARGYLHDEVRTRERFIAPPDGGQVREHRLYRTGDRCRWTEDGEIEFLGRIDQQVKLRGFRIELEEVEAALASMPGVDDAAAAVVEAVNGKPMLAGYVVSRNGAVDSEAVRTFVAARLPGYMVPQVVMDLVELPRLPNDKLDRKRLPTPQVGPPAGGGAAVARAAVGDGLAGTGAEAVGDGDGWARMSTLDRQAAVLAIVQREIARFLRLDDPAQVPPQQTLDTLGLDSLDSVELSHRLSGVFGRTLPASLLVEHPTPEAVAGDLARRLTGDAAERTIDVPAASTADTLGRFQSQIQAGHPPFLAARVPAWSATDKGTLLHELKGLLARSGREPYSKLVRTGSGHRGTVADVHTGEAHDAIIWSTNLYLGLNRDRDVIAQARTALEQFGTGMGTSPTASGMTDLHVAFEKEFAELVGKPAGCLFSTGFTANLGVIAGLLGERDVVVMDQLCHASIVDGARLSGATIRTFKHNDADDLHAVLEAEASPYRTTLVVLEGVYSMGEGTAPVAEIVRTAKRHGALVFVDEAHSFGFYGPGGGGICAEQGIVDQVDFIMTTLSKALGSLGGVVVASEAHIALLKTAARAYVFQATTTPADIAAALAALRRLRDDDALRQRLWDTTRYMRERFTAAGYDLGTGDGPIVTPHFADSDMLYAIARGLHDRGIHTTAVTYPIVERGRGRLRLICSAAHSRDDVDRTLEALIEVERIVKRDMAQARSGAHSEADDGDGDAQAGEGRAFHGGAGVGAGAGRGAGRGAEAQAWHAELAAWAHAFGDELGAALADEQAPVPSLAISIRVADHDVPVWLSVDGRAVTVGVPPPQPLPTCTLVLKDADAVAALRGFDVKALLEAGLEGRCVMSGQAEPFVWLVARLTSKRDGGG
ncbi:amino acid adenylation domain-containing protein [Luteimonas abyssi]|uniref:amino acid adenylation domain-containing protein n=1 Tax=Luteimonas abyssi TaxID=1247514 RepID=UPI000A5F7B7E|nr:amino acid adenylation domain-containing protein [Luteimonas abyssi]